MPIRKVPGSDLSYYLIAFDKDGREREEAVGELLSARIAHDVTASPPSDIFIFSHGWLGDIRGAISQYDDWTAVVAAQAYDIARVQAARGDSFRPLLVGFHWPSKPWGDEQLGGASFANGATATVDDLVETFVERLSGSSKPSPELIAAVRTIVEAAADDR
ncbi:MAG: hypothetical protein HGA19_13830, partial [Oscillochloris sp.]|nr:hypothetical protein [Oscillochloris sp.]